MAQGPDESVPGSMWRQGQQGSSSCEQRRRPIGTGAIVCTAATPKLPPQDTLLPKRPTATSTKPEVQNRQSAQVTHLLQLFLAGGAAVNAAGRQLCGHTLGKVWLHIQVGQDQRRLRVALLQSLQPQTADQRPLLGPGSLGSE